VQDLQGPEGYQYGGVYRSTDAGETWTRINSVNPRPMYYSQIRVDPVDENNIYVLGTSLYKSSDGGVTFTGDGHGNEVHVDHHAMWIDPRDSRHIILGNDGGVYVTHDRMQTWDHHNHFAIGQFYHVGVDATPDYKIYGGLQDNGSWGGPRRSRYGSTINSDWFRIGGGDGFICLVDPEDPDQLYAESQNGAMSRFNLRTGERGSIRPQPPQGVRYRFNWKTPFILSPHNSRIHFSAGNYVFRSYNRGTAVEAISPEITNTNQGSGSAIAESPVRAGVLYVGTTDGALWVTQNGGQDWQPIYHVPVASDAETPAEQPEGEGEGEAQSDEAATEQKATEQKATEQAATEQKAMTQQQAAVQQGDVKETDVKETDVKEAKEQGAEEKTAAEQAAAKPPVDPLTGLWDGRFSTSDGEIAGEFEMELTLDVAGKVLGQMSSDEGSLTMTDGSFDREKGQLQFTIETPLGPIQPLFELKDQELTARLPLPTGSVLTITATKRPPVRPLVPTALNLAQETAETKPQETAETAAQTTAAEAKPQETAAPDDPAAKPAAEEPKPGSLASFMPGPRWVSSIEASRFAPGRCYITLDGHRSNDDQVYVFATEDYGQTWRSLRSNLPVTAGIAWVIREDLVNQNVLYLGCELSTWVSIDRGQSWSKFSTLPTVAVHELAQHPTSGELIAGTHGRSIWVLDVTAIRQMSTEGLAKPVNLLRPNQVIRWRSLPERGSNTTRQFSARTPAKGAEIFYTLERQAGAAVVVVKNITGRELYRAEAPTAAGLNRVDWNLRSSGPPAGGPRPGGGQAGGRGRPGGAPLANGVYLVELIVDGETVAETLSILGDPDYPTSPIGRGEEEESSDFDFGFIDEDGEQADGEAAEESAERSIGNTPQLSFDDQGSLGGMAAAMGF
jgi:photosystem II stability/assembly factor-like uncharacterized protein